MVAEDGAGAVAVAGEGDVQGGGEAGCGEGGAVGGLASGGSVLKYNFNQPHPWDHILVASWRRSNLYVSVSGPNGHHIQV